MGDFLKELRLIEGRNTGFPNAKKALMENGSQGLRFSMNQECDYISVIIPVHDYFVSGKGTKEKAYEEKILAILKAKPLTLTELALSMGYKGITKKLSLCIERLCVQGRIEQVAENKSIKYRC